MQLQAHQQRYHHASHRRMSRAHATAGRPLVPRCVAAAASGSGPHPQGVPSPAETARTVLAICQDGTFCTIESGSMTPMGTPVGFVLDKQGTPLITLAADSIELRNLATNPRCSLKVQPSAYPARALASVTLMGQLGEPLPPAEGTQGNTASFPLAVDKCLYFGGMDQIQTEFTGEELRAAEPDMLRNDLEELIKTWNDERAEDIYRIVSSHLKVPLIEMNYAELLWVDRLGMYVRVEAHNHLDGLVIARVPFYRPVMDERDARSVITMAAQLAWEEERPYTPPIPSIFSDPAAAANN